MNNFVNLIKSLTEPANKIEGALIDMYVAFILPYAVGKQLDTIGARVGQAREGLGDNDYRNAIKARIAVNRSTGSWRDLKRVVLAFVPTVRMASGGGVAFLDIGAVGYNTAALVYRFAVKAVEATVRLQTFYLTDTVGNSFTLARAAISTDVIAGGSVPVQNADYLPDYGTVLVGVGTAIEETASYTSRTATHLHGLTAINAHPAGTAFQLTNNATQGFGSTANPAIGGKFAGVIGS